jgi:hypothetical protein
VRTTAAIEGLATSWRQRWPEAIGLWSRFTRLRDPLLCTTTTQAREAGLDGSFAMIRLTDQLVVIDLEQVIDLGLTDLPLEILGHEIGHHILCPATLTDQGRMLARMRWALPSVEQAAPAVANLYADLHINDRLQRGSGLHLDEVYRRLKANAPAGPISDLWRLYQRIYEILWARQRGELAPSPLPDRIEGDAQLASRLVRAYRSDWIDGAAGFAALCLPYLTQDPDARQVLTGWGDALDTAGGSIPPGLTELGPGEQQDPLHPARDPRVTDGALPPKPKPMTREPAEGSDVPTRGQHREPFEYGELLRALGLELTDHEVAVRYYREAAQRHLIPFPSHPSAVVGDLVPEGYTQWTVGEPLADVDWLHSILRSPRVVPGVTTVRRVLGPEPDTPPRPEPLDLDLYIDSSGSIANPQVQISFLALAGSIIALSCLRSGGRVQATLWSGARQFETTAGFITDSERILRIVTGYIGGATAFPIHVLRDTYADRGEHGRPVHVLVISDDGVTTMFDRDELGGDGSAIARQALGRARGGGTMVLNLYRWPGDLAPAVEMGWDVVPITGWDELLGFARRFARRTYADDV